MKRPSPANLLFFCLLLLFVLLGVFLPEFDRDLTMRLHHAADPGFTSFMGRTLFQGDLPGGGDLVIFGMLAMLAGYFLASFGAGPKCLQRWLPSFGFALFAGLASAVCLVHGIKWVVGRARPAEVVSKGVAYSDWFQLGPHYISEGAYRGSFPSGHTLAALLVMLGAYVLAGDRTQALKLRTAGWMIGLLGLAYAGGMSIARAMSLAHWLSDGMLGILLGWMVIHACYFWVLKVPQQNRHPDIRKQLPFLFELRFGILVVLATVGFTSALLGLRGFFLLGFHPLVLLIPFGTGIGLWAARRGVQLYRKLACLIETTGVCPD